MGIFTSYFQKEAPKQDAGPPPKEGAARFWFIVRSHWTKLVMLNALQLLFSVPIVTMPAAMAGANRVYFLLLRDGRCEVWSDFWGEFKQSFLRTLVTGLVLGGVAALGAVGSNLSMQLFGGTAGILLGGLELAIGIFSWAALQYAMVLAAMTELNAKTLMKNGAILTLAAYKSTLFLLAAPGLLLLAQVLLFPFSIPVLLTVGIGLCQMGICAIARVPIDRYVIAPYHERESKSNAGEDPAHPEPEI